MQQETILLIDDEAAIRESISLILMDEGYRVVTAENGRDGLDLFFSESIDLVMTDLRMPVMDGIEVMTAIQAHDPEIPMIVISGAGKKHDLIKALQMGAKDYISKPVTDLDMLIHVVSKVLETWRLVLENRKYRKQLEKSEARYRTITQQIAEGVFTVDEQENLTFVNPAFCRMTGVPREQLTGMNLEEISTPESFSVILEQTQNRKRGMTGRYEIQMISAGGVPVHVELACSPMFDDQNRYAGAIAVVRDITKLIELKQKYLKFIKEEPEGGKHTIPICANCKSIRGDNRNWQQVEEFFSHLVFSHGICPDCCERLYPDIDLEEISDE